MRDRVALTAARTAAVASRLVVVMVLVPVALAVTAQGASATALADDGVAQQTVSFGFFGPVGIAAVAIGAGGMVVGLLRHRRRVVTTVPVADTRTDVTQPVEPAAGERVA
ncbi:hypothetical protein [Actinophytocola gossypii]|uniref:Uncharacterized protein n=1 Tax=Actinophytocola gossypii TaxID=2812003 RepID=A0ABT2JE32_9PSEU|nr:hypothetical protein [Actinophytocola gossypii]MCT2586115.1 hypothetical protein [Actinophytocola gossypii]